jgi:hypothetical protein
MQVSSPFKGVVPKQLCNLANIAIEISLNRKTSRIKVQVDMLQVLQARVGDIGRHGGLDSLGYLLASVR